MKTEILTAEEKKRLDDLLISIALRPNVKKVTYECKGRDKKGIADISVWIYASETVRCKFINAPLLDEDDDD